MSPHTAHRTKALRIGCATGFWGDSEGGATQLVMHGGIDYLVFDFLAEITMSLLARARAKSPDAGYAPDFVRIVASLAGEIKSRGIKVVSNGTPNAFGVRFTDVYTRRDGRWQMVTWQSTRLPT